MKSSRALPFGGFALERAPAIVPPIFVAALREKMLALAGQEADGVLLGLGDTGRCAAQCGRPGVRVGRGAKSP